jgi:hypothetical protein
MARYIRIGIIGGAIWSLAGISLLLMKIVPANVSAPVFETGFIVLSVSLVFGFLLRFRKDSLICDERSMRVVMYSLAYSWFATLGIAVALFWVYRLHWLTFTIPAIFVIWILSMAVSGFLFYLFLARRGTIE